MLDITNAKNKCKAAWKIIKDKEKCFYNKDYINKLDGDNGTIVDPTNIAEIFNYYFITLNRDNNTFQANNETGQSALSHSVFLTPCNSKEIEKIIKTLKNASAVGYDDVSTKIMKAVAT